MIWDFSISQTYCCMIDHSPICSFISSCDFWNNFSCFYAGQLQCKVLEVCTEKQVLLPDSEMVYVEIDVKNEVNS